MVFLRLLGIQISFDSVLAIERAIVATEIFPSETVDDTNIPVISRKKSCEMLARVNLTWS